MNRQKWICLAAALVVIGGTSGILARARLHQQLGKPGIKTLPIAGSLRLEIPLPDSVLDYKAQVIQVDPNFLTYMPQDTSISQRWYTTTNNYPVQMNVVLMGVDRTSIHKPEFCLTGQGWVIDDTKTVNTSIHMQLPRPYDLPVQRFTASSERLINGQKEKVAGIYIFWFVADNALTSTHLARNWSMARQVLTTGVLQRWAYVSVFGFCRPGEEEATSRRLEQFIQAAVPQFQLVPGPDKTAAAVASAAPKQFD